MNPAAKSFDLDNAQACLSASAAAYRLATISSPRTDTHVLISQSPLVAVVAFRGSASIRNWITDADFARVVLISGVDGTVSRIHKGFNAALSSVLEELIHTLGGCPKPGETRPPIFLTGHSLGGALAVLAALELQRNGFPIAGVYTFGQPRVGNGAYARRYNGSLGDRTWRLVYQEDIVPRIPHLPAIHDLYQHVGQEVFISSLKPPTSVDDLWFNPPLWRVLASDIWGLWRAWTVSKFAGALDPVHDHHINNYALALNSIAGAAPRPVGTPGLQTPSEL